MIRSVLAAVVTCVFLAGCGTTGAGRPPADPGVITFQSALANRYVHADQSGEVLVQLQLASKDVEEPLRPAVDLALVIDTSGSMEGKPIEDARAASLAVVEAMKDGDRLAVVAFGSKSEVLLPSTVIDSASRAKARACVAAMKAEGTTDLAGGLSAGISEVAAHLDPKGINRVVLVGDGVPNDQGPVLGLAQSAAGRGIAITTLGLGPDYNEVLMGAIAQASGGHFHYVDDSSKVAAFLHDQVLRLESVYAKATSIELVPGPGVRIEAVIGHTGERTGRGMRLSVGDLGKGDRRDLFVRLAVEPHHDGAPVELLDAVLTFEDGYAGAGHVERRTYLAARATTSDSTFQSGRDPRVEDAAATARAAAATIEAIEAARAGDARRAEEVLDRGALEAEEHAKRSGNKALDERARKMRSLAPALPAPTTAPAPAPVADHAVAPPAKPKPVAPAERRKLLEAHDEAFNQL